MHHIKLVYGDDIITAELARLGEYVAVVDPVAWGLCSERIDRAPEQCLAPDDLEQETLDRLAEQMPASLPLVGIGGGLVIDATKYLAMRREQTAVLVPSITSSNAPFSDAIAVRRDGVPIGMRSPQAPKRIVVDFSLILAAEPRLNRAGYADLLAHETALGDVMSGQRAPVTDETRAAYEHMKCIMLRARTIAPAVGAVTEEGIRALMELFRESTGLAEAHPGAGIGAGSEHLLAWNLEATTGRHFAHGEVVALGILLAAHLQGGDVVGLRAALESAKVRFVPEDLGLDWSEVVGAVRTVGDYNRRVRRWPSVFDRLEITDDMLAELRSVVAA